MTDILNSGMYKRKIPGGNLMKVKIVGKTSILIVFFVIISLLMIASCSSKSLILDDKSDNEEANISISSNADLLTSYKNSTDKVTTVEYSSPLKKELEGLRYVLSPYLVIEDDLFIGYENKDYIEKYFLNPDTSNLSMNATDWEIVVRLLFAFDDKDCPSIKAYITDYAFEDKIERQYAVAGLMNLLPLRYSLSLDTDSEDMQKSIVITDLEYVGEEHKSLICKAFHFGFTDLSVDSSRLFRPNAYLNRGEAISMFYRIFTNLGLPGAKYDDSIVRQDTANSPEEISILNQQQAYCVEDFFNEYREYKDSLLKNEGATNKARLEMLTKAEELLKINFYTQISNETLNIDKWIEIVSQVFKINTEEIKTYITCSTDNTLTYDIAAKSIFEFSYLMGNDKPRDASEEELAAAREAIPQFDTAEDISKFAQMFSSGILEGIYKIPGFTPKRPVNNAEALLLIMRIVKELSIQ